MRNLNNTDNLLGRIDQVLRITTGNSPAAHRANPADALAGDEDLASEDREDAGRLMRVNHCGEVCAQALYAGQASTSRDHRTAETMRHAAQEEQDHLAWCEDRLKELDTPVSRLNPLFYGLSYTAGAIAGLMGSRINLGFVAATEDQVAKHLEEHLQRLPEGDNRSRAIIEQMYRDETSHRQSALDEGGAEFPRPIKTIMTGMSRLMTRTTYWI